MKRLLGILFFASVCLAQSSISGTVSISGTAALGASGGGGAIGTVTLVQNNNCAGVTSCAFTSALTAGNSAYVLIHCTSFGGSAMATAVSGSTNGAYSLIASAGVGINGPNYWTTIQAAIKSGVASGAETVSVTTTAGYCDIRLFELNGTTAAPSVDQSTNASSAVANSTISAGPVTTSVNTEFAIAAYTSDTAVTTAGGTGWTAGTGLAAGAMSDNAETRSVATPTAITGDWTTSAFASGAWAANIVSFKSQ